MKISWTLLPMLALNSQEIRDCPRMWHVDETTGKCRPGIEHVQLKCSGEMIEVQFNDIVFGDSMAISVNNCTTGYGIKMSYNARTIRIDPQVCDSHVHFEDDEVILRNYINIGRDGVVYSIPVDCVFQRSNEQHKDHHIRRSRREAVATAHSRFDIKLQYVDSVFAGPLPSDRRLIVGEEASVIVGLQQRIKGIEMAVTNCTVFDEDYAQSYSVVDYPRCPDNRVKANIQNPSNQWENRLTYRVFEFVNAQLDTALLKLVCRVILCDARQETSECRTRCGEHHQEDTLRLV